MSLRLRISPSALGSYKHCPMHFKLSYIDKVKPMYRGTIYSILGLSIHETIDSFYKLFTENETREYFILEEIFERTFRSKTTEILPMLPHATYLDFLDAGKKMLKNYYKYDFDENNIIHVLHSEKKFVVDCGDFDLVGIVDRSYKKDDKIFITDYKTSTTVRSQKDVDKDDQLSLYSWMYRKVLGLVPDTLCLYFLRADKKVFTNRTGEQLDAFFNSVVDFKNMVMAQTEFEPNFKGCGMCDFKFNCPASQKKKIRLT